MLSRWSLNPSALVGEKVEGDLGERRGDGHVTMGQRLGDAAPNQETPGASEAGRGRGGSTLEPLERAPLCRHLEWGLWPPEL